MANLTYEDLVRNGYRWVSGLGLVSTKSKRVSRVLKPRANRDGYLYYKVSIDGKQREMKQHRIVWEATYGILPPGMEINHKNSIRNDNRLENLEAVTHSENIKHGYEFGNLDKSGEKNGRSKLTEKQVREIQGLAEQGLSQRKIVAQFGVSPRQVGRILRGEQWGHIYKEFHPNSP